MHNTYLVKHLSKKEKVLDTHTHTDTHTQTHTHTHPDKNDVLHSEYMTSREKGPRAAARHAYPMSKVAPGSPAPPQGPETQAHEPQLSDHASP